ncbi:Protein VAC14-like protein [Zea mays]|uniref:Protein VAC14-like protein n=1 Tax=Zea mays TaxID=4577 RepID=A0A1D6MTH0_MAIZE|nr:Protein VAC14-like protein [Zea mays]
MPHRIAQWLTSDQFLLRIIYECSSTFLPNFKSPPKGFGNWQTILLAGQHEQIVPHVLNSFLDQDSRVRYYACEALYNIAKDIVTESDQFSIEEFIPLLRERMNVLNPYVRQFLVGWITVLDSVPDIDMLGFLPDFLDGCLHIYAFNTDYHTLNGKNVDYGRMAEIIVRRAGSTDEFTRLTSITWVICLSCFSCDRKT